MIDKAYHFGGTLFNFRTLTMYYTINLECEPKVIGVQNGIYQVSLDQKAYSKESWRQLISDFKSTAFNPNDQGPEIDYKLHFKSLKSAKWTTFMSFSPFLNHCHFLIQRDILELLKSFNFQPSRDFEAEIYDSKTMNLDNSYRLFYSAFQDWNVIDFSRTVFTSGGFGNQPKLEHVFKDEEEMKNYTGIIHVKTLVLSKDFDNSLDFFHPRVGGLFVSEKLKLVLEKNDITGVDFSSRVQVVTQ